MQLDSRGHWNEEPALHVLECGVRAIMQNVVSEHVEPPWSDFQGHHTISLHSGLPSIYRLVDGDSATTNTMHHYNNHYGGNYTICQQKSHQCPQHSTNNSHIAFGV